MPGSGCFTSDERADPWRSRRRNRRFPGVGLGVCFSREASFPEPLQGPGRVDPTTVAHELLHLFGATDKYGQPLRSFPPGSVSSRDIMRLNHDQLTRMTIDSLTASEVGWSPILAGG